MSKALETAPGLPAGSVDFTKFNAACARGDADAVEKAVIDVLPKEEPAPATPAAKSNAD